MSQIQAIYRKGVFEPVEPVTDVQENERVRLTVERPNQQSAMEWFKEVTEFREKLREKHGTFPDSTQDIAADRTR